MTEFLIFIGAVIVLGLVVFFVVQKKRRKFSPRDKKWVAEKWKKIEGLAKTRPENAVLEADKLCDWALKKCGYLGSFGDKVKKAKSLFSMYDGLWKAHRLRNKIAHEIDVIISEGEAKRALASFRQALRDMGAL